MLSSEPPPSRFPEKPLANCYWVNPQLLAGEYPGSIDSGEARSKVGALLDVGISHFIDLTERFDSLAPYESLVTEESRRRGHYAHYENFPIRDVSVASNQQMSRVLRAIERAHRSGRSVYVHCWGGVGRTGMVIGCWLTEQGLTGDEALTKLHTLYETMSPAKLARRPTSPETSDQSALVRGWPDNPLSKAGIARRTRGCLLAGAAGDALGAAVEFESAEQIHSRFGTAGIRDFAEAYGRRGAITDDTQMTLFTAEGLLRAQARLQERGVSTLQVVMFAYLRWLATQGYHISNEWALKYPGWLFSQQALHHPRAPGNTCVSALLAYDRGEELTSSIARNNSKGCGGVMRVAPAGLILEFSPERAFDTARKLAAMTHGHPTGSIAAGAFALIIRELLEAHDLQSAVEAAIQHLHTVEHAEETIQALEAASRLGQRSLGEPPGSSAHAEAIETLGGGWVAEEALAIGVYSAIAAGASLEDGIRIAVNHGGDSDSTGSIAGNILGVIMGEGAIPKRWLDDLELRDVIAQVGDDLAADHEYEEAWLMRYPPN